LPNSANPFETIKDKWTINNKTNSFDKMVEKEKTLCQNSDKPLETKNEDWTIDRQWLLRNQKSH
jgi:hypothetical protein